MTKACTYTEDLKAGHGHLGKANALSATAVIVDDKSIRSLLNRKSSGWKECLKSCYPGTPCALPPAHRSCLEVGWHPDHRRILPVLLASVPQFSSPASCALKLFERRRSGLGSDSGSVRSLLPDLLGLHLGPKGWTPTSGKDSASHKTGSC